MQESERNLVKLIVPRNEAKQRIEGQCSQLQEILRVEPKGNSEFAGRCVLFDRWHDYTFEMLRLLFSNDELANEFNSIQQPKITSRMRLSEKKVRLMEYAKRKHYRLLSILSRIDLYPESQPDVQMDARKNAVNVVERLATRFNLFASRLATRQRQREPFKISDEYDLQDVFHALLKLFFDDVRPEQYTPSYAGKSSKIDFILKPQQIVVELKMTNAKLGEKEVADQLIIDIDRYRSHPDCRTIIFFVYDPQHLIKNPIGLENDLSRLEDNVDVKVIISPK